MSEHKTYQLKNDNLQISINETGNLTNLVFADDERSMNWMIDPSYLESASYEDADKLFGKFEIVIGGNRYTSHNARECNISTYNNVVKVSYKFSGFVINIKYDLGKSEHSNDMIFKVAIKNTSDKFLIVEDFRVWTSFAYVMFRDTDVIRNMEQSCAAFPSISPDYTKIALFRRSNNGPHLGFYQLRGQTKSIGTYCDYSNLFFENVSPSLDGMLFHQLVLAGGYVGSEEPKADWIYDRSEIKIEPRDRAKWSYGLCEVADKNDFYNVGLKLGAPKVDYSPMTLAGKTIEADVTLPANKQLERVVVEHYDDEVKEENYQDFSAGPQLHLSLPVAMPGEHKVNLVLSDGSIDSFVVNVMDALPTILQDRADYICNVLYQGAEGDVPYCFSPVSPQGESLGKLNLVLKTNLLGKTNQSQVQKVEASAVNYIKPKWFIDGDFAKPAKLYGDFYRVMDFEYIGHTFYLLSKFRDEDLAINDAATYLDWALQIFELRVNPDMHDNERAKEETQMLGVFFLYVPELLADLKKAGEDSNDIAAETGEGDTDAAAKYNRYCKLWDDIVKRVGDGADSYKGAITEHYYDNAGFGPSAGALAMNGHETGAAKYAELLEANIGFSNDFRAQNPDRWWEALSYMIHSLWGGMSAASMLKVYEWSGNYKHLEAAYRATVGILYCYDTNATATDLKLNQGEAASTYSVAGPMINLPKLSRNRFGQSVFAELGGIFSRLFQNNDSTMDWDMGEELTAYLDGFGIKTFVYEKDGQICVANGSIRKCDEGYEIESYAPYPREYHFIDKDLYFVCPDGQTTDKVLLTEYGFEKTS